MTCLGDPTIIVSGSGRSGTTWLGNVIAGDEIRILFEPFDPRKVPAVRGLGLRPYFRPNDSYLEWYHVIKRIIAGDINNDWVDQDISRLNHLKKTNRILIKEIRVNGMLAWLDRNFPCKVVYLIRNPRSVVCSRINAGWEANIDFCFNQPQLINDFLFPYRDIIFSAKTQIQKHSITWCIENLIPLSQICDHSWIFCTYEKLIEHPEDTISRILSELNLEFTQERKKAVKEISRTAADVRMEDISDRLMSSELDDIDRTVHAFGLERFLTRE